LRVMRSVAEAIGTESPRQFAPDTLLGAFASSLACKSLSPMMVKRILEAEGYFEPQKLKISEWLDSVFRFAQQTGTCFGPSEEPGLPARPQLSGDNLEALWQALQNLCRMPAVVSVVSIRERLDPRTGVAPIGSLAGMADTLDCRPETLRCRIRELAEKGLIVKNEGNATSTFSTSGGITIALALPETVWNALNPQQSTATPYPSISDTTGIATPDFQTQPGRKPSRSPYSHEVGGDEASSSQAPTGPDHGGVTRRQGTHLTALWSKPDPTLGDWIEAGVIHAEFGDHLERLADERGKGAVSRVLERLKDLRTIRKSLAEIRRDAERAADLAARSVARKAGKRMGLSDTDIKHMVEKACPASIEIEDTTLFVREMARHLDAIIREAQGNPDPWGTHRWRRGQQQVGDHSKANGNAYAVARHKRDPSAFS
jgi:hypothetical protein